MSVAAGASDAAGDATGDGAPLGSAPLALTHIKTISANKIRVAVIRSPAHRGIDSQRSDKSIVASPKSDCRKLRCSLRISKRHLDNEVEDDDEDDSD